MLSDDALAALWLSARLALWVTPAYFAVGALLAWALVFGLKRPAWLDALVTIPIAFPPVVIGFALLWLLGRLTLLGQTLISAGVGFVFSFPGCGWRLLSGPAGAGALGEAHNPINPVKGGGL